MTLPPGTPAIRRRVALLFLVVGAVLLVRAIDGDLPRDQTVVLRLGEPLRSAPLRVTASITRAGESEARSGFSLTRTGAERSDPRQTFRAPNGEYVVTVDWDELSPPGPTGTAAEKRETSSVHRVRLAGGDVVVVPIGPRVSE